jgi:nucleoside 2-deoxyribosyltransferase
MKVYLASRYSTKPQMEEYAKELRSLGIEVTSRWLEETHASDADISVELKRKYALMDLEDVGFADVLVFFSVEPTTPMVRGGRHVEFGYALGLGIPIIVVGPKENIFHFTPYVQHVNNWAQALNEILERDSYE